MYTYSEPRIITYSFGEHDFGAGGEVLSLRGPLGFVGKLVGVQVNATETFTATTLQGTVLVGTAGDTDAYGLLNLGTLADTDTASEATDTDAILASAIPADTQVEVNLTAPTGGTPAGKGYTHITIEWSK